MYARLGEDRVAYQVLGEGPDLVLTLGAFGHVDLQWEDPATALFLRRLASFSRLILFDRRGTGASDPLPEDLPPPWESYADEVAAVMDAAGSRQAALMATTAEAGGLRAVTASHPHFYGSMAAWSSAFDADVLVPEADLAWLTHPPVRPPVTWSGSLAVLAGVTLVQCGGHFAGSAVAHWTGGAGGAGAMLSGDTIFVTPGEDRVTFVRSAPNRLPLPERAVRAVVEAVRPYRYDRIYGGWWQPVLRADAKAVVERSAERYIQWLRGEVPEDP